MKPLSPLSTLEQAILQCEQCPRLRSHCQKIAHIKKRSFQKDSYWGKPVSGFGAPKAQLFILGLAPAAHGANRTGRVFTGDRSGEWLYRALHKAGFANQAQSIGPGDDLQLRNAYISCVVKCAPPGNKPTPQEILNCTPFLTSELKALSSVTVYLALGQLAYETLWRLLKSGVKRPPFQHGLTLELDAGKTLLLSYHPSQQNTFTGKLTEPMFDSVFQKAQARIRSS